MLKRSDYMELLYLWINHTEPECIDGQEFNFSPKYKFNVDNLERPHNVFCKETKSINLLKINDDKNQIDNITAVVGANGSGKTTLLSFIATNGCERKIEERENYTESDLARYECRKSIYIFIEKGDLIVYHNLEEELKCDFETSNTYWNEPCLQLKSHNFYINLR